MTQQYRHPPTPYTKRRHPEPPSEAWGSQSNEIIQIIPIGIHTNNEILTVLSGPQDDV